VIPAAFDYELAGSVDEAIQLLAQGGEDAKLIAGGHSLLPLMKLRLARPSLLVDIERLTGLDDVRDSGDSVEIGALARMYRLADDPVLEKHCGLVAYAAGQVGDPQVRHRATIGGSVAHGDPASDLPTVLLTLDAEFVARGPDGERTIPASEMFTSLFETALRPNEVLTTIRVPKLGGAGWSYQKFHRRAIDWAIVGVAAVVEKNNGTAGRTRIGLTNMGLTPLRATAVEQRLHADTQGSPDQLRQSAELAPEGTSPPSDTNGSAEYRRELAKVLVRRALEEALAR
jgi:aerobic carbon-monoxide dehydrogenase medium subunit